MTSSVRQLIEMFTPKTADVFPEISTLLKPHGLVDRFEQSLAQAHAATSTGETDAHLANVIASMREMDAHIDLVALHSVLHVLSSVTEDEVHGIVSGTASSLAQNIVETTPGRALREISPDSPVLMMLGMQLMPFLDDAQRKNFALYLYVGSGAVDAVAFHMDMVDELSRAGHHDARVSSAGLSPSGRYMRFDVGSSNPDGEGLAAGPAKQAFGRLAVKYGHVYAYQSELPGIVNAMQRKLHPGLA